MVTRPSILIISNKFDFSTDFITHLLNTHSVPYLRLNRDQLGEYEIFLDPLEPKLIARLGDQEYIIANDSLKSIYYRAPTFLRDIVQENLSEDEQLFRTQWAAFVRSLAVFENAKWVNHPVDTYKAEIKPLQLLYAKQVGFNTPTTSVTNVASPRRSGKFAIKSIDTAIINNGDQEAFVYTSIVNGTDIVSVHYSSPFFIQQGLTPKIDIRITIIDDSVIAVKIFSAGGIADDWRKFKGEIKYEIFALPSDIKEKCLQFTKLFNLTFAAIDMVIYNDQYFFIEVNPTGEWAWLQQNTGYRYDSLIVNSLTHGNLE